MDLNELNLSHAQWLKLARGAVAGAMRSAREELDANAPGRPLAARDVRERWHKRVGELIAVERALAAVSPLVPKSDPGAPISLTEMPM